mgnify:CR=1 FL=1
MTDKTTEQAAPDEAKRPVELLVMPDDLRMDAYYYGFNKTGVREIDEILSAVAMAGKGYHNTADWSDEIYGETYSFVDLIQEIANRAAKKWFIRNYGKELKPGDTGYEA